MKIIFAYIISIFLSSVVVGIVSVLLFKSLPVKIIRKYKKILPFFLGISMMFLSVLSVLIIIYVFRFFAVEHSFYAIILYAFLLLKNDIKRIINIKKNRSPVRLLMISNQEEDSYDKKADLKKEYFCLIGGLIGLFLGLFLI